MRKNGEGGRAHSGSPAPPHLVILFAWHISFAFVLLLLCFFSHVLFCFPFCFDLFLHLQRILQQQRVCVAVCVRLCVCGRQSISFWDAADVAAVVVAAVAAAAALPLCGMLHNFLFCFLFSPFLLLLLLPWRRAATK